jgi:hypothetical protein
LDQRALIAKSARRVLPVFSHQSGWYPIIESLCLRLEKTEKSVRLVQVKEKFGGLRVYWESDHDPGDAESQCIHGLILGMEKWASHTCELCGLPGTFRNEPGRHWIRTLCNYHASVPEDALRHIVWRLGDLDKMVKYGLDLEKEKQFLEMYRQVAIINVLDEIEPMMTLEERKALLSPDAKNYWGPVAADPKDYTHRCLDSFNVPRYRSEIEKEEEEKKEE